MKINVKDLRRIEVEYAPSLEDPQESDDSEQEDGDKKWDEKPEPGDDQSGQKNKKKKSTSGSDGSDESDNDQEGDSGDSGDSEEDGDQDGGEPGQDGNKPGQKSGGQLKPTLTAKKPTSTEELKDYWKREVESARDRTAGSMPGSLLRAIDTLLSPKVDWKQNLRKFAQAVASKSEYFLPARRFLGGGDVLWGSKKPKATFDTLFIIGDTSGSIAPKELEQFVSETMDIMKIYNPKETYLLWCDTTIYEPVDVIKKGEPWRVKTAPGGGGTSFIPPFAWIEKNILRKKKMGPVIFFTDGYPNTGPNGGWPRLEEYGIRSYSSKVLWVIVGKGMPNKDPSIKIPFGTRIDLIV